MEAQFASSGDGCGWKTDVTLPAVARSTTSVTSEFSRRHFGLRHLLGVPCCSSKPGREIRVPHIVRWPARIPTGETFDRLAIGMDWMATFPAAAGVSAHPDYPLDGINLFGDEIERNLYWRMKYRNQKAVRSGVWKYLSIDGNEFLYDRSRDERERANMRYRGLQKFAELRDAYLEWERSMPPIPEEATHEHVYSEETMARSAG